MCVFSSFLSLYTAIRDNFVQLDTNNDDYLSSREFAVYFLEDNEVVASIFGFLDKNYDNLASMEEIVTAIEGLETVLPTEEGPDSTEDPEGELAQYLHDSDTNY